MRISPAPKAAPVSTMPTITHISQCRSCTAIAVVTKNIQDQIRGLVDRASPNPATVYVLIHHKLVFRESRVKCVDAALIMHITRNQTKTRPSPPPQQISTHRFRVFRSETSHKTKENPGLIMAWHPMPSFLFSLKI